MANLKKRFKEILEDLEKNIKNKEDLEYIKSQVYNISILFLDEIDKIAELNLDRINVMLEREKELANKITKMEKMIANIEKEVFISPNCDFEIICPYCNTEFVEDLTDEEHEVRCPECGNEIEIDWHDDYGKCEHNCSEKCDDDECECNCDECEECHDYEEDDIEEYEDENGENDDDM